MNTFHSSVVSLGKVSFPAFGGKRIMMMPFEFHDVQGSLPDSLAEWKPVISQLIESVGEPLEGVGYLTLDEAEVQGGETHRRPGLHVDGIGEDGKRGVWGGGGGGGGGYAKVGMILAASHTGCVAYDQTFEGMAGPNGDCEHLSDQ
ncbi:MAG: hypothetical protein AAGM67_05830, partial [Bacteroidota bacterium]